MATLARYLIMLDTTVEEAVGDVVILSMEPETVILPDGQQLPASLENRRRAAELWQLDNSGSPERA